MKELPRPILSRRWRRIVFIPTTLQKLLHAIEINDLFDDSPLEDKLWALFKQYSIPAERQELVTIGQENFFLDFAIYCNRGKIDVETDGDTYHANPEKVSSDNHRNNILEAAGWKVLRFETAQIKERAERYCIPIVSKTIQELGDVDEGKLVPRKINLDVDGAVQLGLFDDPL